ncbi:N-acetylmuramoyl-L-alanine amidase, partial [Anaerosalibacter bizertensis]|uniref:N-acetylmuramoyl-L-alanine amidase n=1 Tax=Anaerosalibacter bizertensis TaxID=932217 RepID=UPI001C0EF1E1
SKYKALAESNGWYKITANGKTGWVSGAHVKEVKAIQENPPKIDKLEVVADVLNVRAKPTTNSAKLTQVKKGSKYKALAESNGWYKITANGKTGWVSGAHVKEVKAIQENPPKIDKLEVVADVLNVRAKPTTNSAKLTQVKKGSKYKALAESNGWYKITANGKTGWVSGAHVKEVKDIQENPPKTPSKISVFLDAGHGGKDPGAEGNGLNEKDIALSIALKTGEILKNHNIDVKYSRTTDVFVELADRASMANNANSDIFVSFHCNSFTDSSAKGTETYHYPGSAEGAKLAKSIQDSIIKNGVYNGDRGVKENTYLVLKQTKMPAALVEMAFISNSQDANILKNRQNEMANAIAMGILDYLEIPYNETSEGLYRVQTGAFSQRENAQNLVDELKAKGYEAMIVEKGGIYKVQVGAFSQRGNADKLAEQLKADGFEAIVVR